MMCNFKNYNCRFGRKNRCEQVSEKSNNTTNNTMGNFSKLLNIIGALLILIIVILFIFWIVYGVTHQRYSKINEIKINLILTDTNKNNNSQQLLLETRKQIGVINDSLNSHLNTLNSLSKSIDDNEQRNNDLFKLFIALIGVVFAIVGFFGFKSINDVRETALKNAVNEAQNTASTKAKEIAEIEAKKISAETANLVAKSVSERISTDKAEKETKKYLDQKFPEYFRKFENTYASSFDEKLVDLTDRIAMLENPESYGIENKDLNELKAKYNEILDFIHAMKLEKVRKQNG